MTVQEVKEKLRSVYTKYREYMLAESKADQFRSAISLPSPVAASDAPRTESVSNGTESKLIAALWYSEQANKKFRDFMTARQEVEAVINSMKLPDEREILTRRYIMFEKWEEIAQKTYISLRHIHRIHGAALAELAEISEKNKDVTKCH